MKKIIFLILGHLCLILGIVGIFLPLLPTTPFLLLAAFLYSKSSTRLHQWMAQHKYLGPPLREWRETGVIRIWAKVLASSMIALVLIFRFPHLPAPLWAKSALGFVLLAVLVFIWTRPSRPPR